MKKAGFWFFCLFSSTLWLQAQVAVEIVMDQEQFLRGENIKTAVRITNLSGRPLRLGEEEDWLTFSVESRDGRIVPKFADVPVQGAFSLESASRATKRVNLEPYFSFGQPGRYSVVANVRIKEWDQERKSKPLAFNIIEGAKLWEQDFGVPKKGASPDAAPEVRKYTLQQANYIKGQLRLYLRVSDEGGGRVLRTVPVGPMLSFSRPETQVDKFSNLHVIYQSWARVFTYSVFNPEAELLTRETYDYVDSRPRLRVDDEGTVSVLGGVKRPAASDVPVAAAPRGGEAGPTRP